MPNPTAPSEAPFLGQHCVTPYSKGEILRRIVWSFVEATLFRWSPRPCHRWRARLLSYFGAKIPRIDQVVVFPTVRTTFPWRLHLAPHTMIGPNVILYNLADIRLQYGANVSQGTHLCAGTHDFNQWSMPLRALPIDVGENVWIAAEVFVGPGVSIGALSVIGARSVVLKDLPPNMICAGSPCKPIHSRETPS